MKLPTVVAKTDNQSKAVLFAGLTKAGTTLTNFVLNADYNGFDFDLGAFSHYQQLGRSKILNFFCLV